MDENNNQNMANGQPQQPQQPQPPQQPYYGQPQQPYYQQPPQQPYYQQPPQQPYYQPQPQPTAPAFMPATEVEKNALFSVAGGLMMLIYAIAASVNLIFGFIGDVLSLNILGILGVIFDILTVVGLWVLWGTAKAKKLTPAGVSLIKVPFVITFIFSLIGGIGGLILNLITFNLIAFLTNLFSFIFSILYFSSINKLLKLGKTIEKNQTVYGKKAGMFAAVVTIIIAVVNLVKGILDKVNGSAILKFITEALGGMIPGIDAAGSTVIIVGIVALVIEFLVSIYAAVMIINFNKKLG